jgi:glycosyltransferase involved in cell wall biosynthesis
MRILIATGIYPPEIGGPAQYAKSLQEAWTKDGHEVSVKAFSRHNSLPTGMRHIAYLFSIWPEARKADLVFALDTFSAALPAVFASKVFGKKIILRTGGDFLWEAYVERTGDLVLLRNFYKTSLPKLSIKERVTFMLIRHVLRSVSAIAWSTEWQKDIFMAPYGLSSQKHFIVENYYGTKVESFVPERKNFIAGTRPLKWKNDARLKQAFERPEVKGESLEYDSATAPHDKFLDKIQRAYGVVIATLGDISPNTILDAIRADKPFILTKETGLYERLRDIALFVDPESEEDIAAKLLFLSDPANYEAQKRKVESFSFTHTWEEMAREYIEICNKIR